MAFGYVGPEFTGEEEVVWKCEGAGDVASLLSLDLPTGHIALSNGCGAQERPADWFLERFAKIKRAYVVGDCDEAGQLGAIGTTDRPGYAPLIARHAAECRNVVLPYPIEKRKGKDLADWIQDQRAVGKDNLTIYRELVSMADQSPAVSPADQAGGDDPPDDIGDDDDQADGDDDSPSLAVLEDDDDPHRLARVNLAVYEKESGGKLVCWNDQFWRYRQGVYRRITMEDLKAKVTATIRVEFERCWRESEADRIEEEERSGRDSEPKAVLKVTTSLVNNVIAATRSMCSMPSSTMMPSWLPTGQRRRYLSLNNGILDLDAIAAGKDPDKWLIPHSSDWFSSVKAPYDFDPNAKCDVWKEFLQDAFNGDEEAIDALQHWFGYVVTQETYLHKMMMVIGEKRSGKGTIARTLRAIIGKESVATPTMSSIAGQYELDGLVDKSLAIIPDARLSKKSDETVITERLLSITGGDPQDVQRKYMTTLRSVELPVRFMLMSNELPALNDASAAIVSRCIVINMPNSYYGRENLKLGDQIEAELPGVLLWAILGANKLRQKENKRIDQPRSGANLLNTFEQVVSPVAKFVDECCVKAGAESVNNLYEEFLEWLKENNLRMMTKEVFSKKLTSACPSVERYRKRPEGTSGPRIAMCHGLSLREDDGDDTLF